MSHCAVLIGLTIRRISSGRASVVKSRSLVARPSSASRTGPPTIASSCPAAANASARVATTGRLGERAEARDALGHVEHASSLPSRAPPSDRSPWRRRSGRTSREARKPVNSSSRTRGSRSARSAAASTSSSWAIASISTPTGRSPSHAPTSAASPGSTASDAAEPAALPQLDDRRVLCAGQVVARLGDVGRDDEDGCREPGVVEGREPIVGGERVGEVRAEAVAGERLRQGLVAGERRAPGIRTAQQDVAEADLGHLPRREVVEPRVDEPRERRRARQRAAVADPQLGVRQRVERSRARRPRRRAAPAMPRPTRARGRARSTPSRVSQLPSSCATPPGARCAPTPVTNAATRSSPTIPPSRYSYAGTPVDPRRDDERRVRHDPVEPLAGDRVEQAPEPRLDAVDVVEQGVQPREAERARRDVGRDDVVDAASGAQRLDAAAGADVEPAPRRAWAAAATRGSATRRRRRARGLRGAARRAPPRRGRSRSTTRPRRRRRRTTAGARARAAAGRRRRLPRARGVTRPSAPVRGSAPSTARGGLRHPEHEQPAEHRERVVRDRRALGRPGARSPRAIASSAASPHAPRSASAV